MFVKNNLVIRGIDTLNVQKFCTLYFVLFWPKLCFSCNCYFKILIGMANNVDPDQTAQEQSHLGLHCLHILLCQTLWCSKF